MTLASVSFTTSTVNSLFLLPLHVFATPCSVVIFNNVSLGGYPDRMEYMIVYDNPHYYEIAFAFRDISAEVDFLEQVIRQYSRVEVGTFLELASGNSPHMREL